LKGLGRTAKAACRTSRLVAHEGSIPSPFAKSSIIITMLEVKLRLLFERFIVIVNIYTKRLHQTNRFLSRSSYSSLFSLKQLFLNHIQL
jgi:hypothetical protein